MVGDKKIKTALSIAGSDSSGGAGIQADIKTMTMNGVYAMSAITALTAQNTTGVYGVMESSPEFLANQLDCIFTDIFPDSVKTGMLSSSALIDVICDKLIEHKAKNIVVDPVMISTSGSKLLSDDAMDTLQKRLLPLATVITPNLPEVQALCGIEVNNADDMKKAAQVLYEKFGCNVLVKGGHTVNDANDLLYDGRNYVWFYGEKIDNPNTHGTGCTLSSAIASNLAKDKDLKTAIENAKKYISGALAYNMDLGKGSGPLNHAFNIKD